MFSVSVVLFCIWIQITRAITHFEDLVHSTTFPQYLTADQLASLSLTKQTFFADSLSRERRQDAQKANENMADKCSNFPNIQNRRFIQDGVYKVYLDNTELGASCFPALLEFCNAAHSVSSQTGAVVVEIPDLKALDVSRLQPFQESLRENRKCPVVFNIDYRDASLNGAAHFDLLSTILTTAYVQVLSIDLGNMRNDISRLRDLNSELRGTREEIAFLEAFRRFKTALKNGQPKTLKIDVSGFAILHTLLNNVKNLEIDEKAFSKLTDVNIRQLATLFNTKGKLVGFSFKPATYDHPGLFKTLEQYGQFQALAFAYDMIENAPNNMQYLDNIFSLLGSLKSEQLKKLALGFHLTQRTRSDVKNIVQKVLSKARGLKELSLSVVGSDISRWLSILRGISPHVKVLALELKDADFIAVTNRRRLEDLSRAGFTELLQITRDRGIRTSCTTSSENVLVIVSCETLNVIGERSFLRLGRTMFANFAWMKAHDYLQTVFPERFLQLKSEAGWLRKLTLDPI